MPNDKRIGVSKLKGIAIGLLCALLLALIALAISTNHSLRMTRSVPVEFYYMNQDNLGMGQETKQIPVGTEQEMLQTALKELQAGPKMESIVVSVPKDITFLNVAIENGVVALDVSKEYNQLSAGTEMICRASIVWTLTSMDFVKYVSISVEGQPITKADGTPIGNMNRENVVIDTVVSPETKRYESFELYFADGEGAWLKPEKREIEVSQNQPKERCILEQLIAGPQDANNLATLPVDTKIRDITTTDDGICYVNLSSEFINKKSAVDKENTLAIYSVVNSITGLPYIEKVQFLIEGEKVERENNGVDISKPLVARPGLVKQ